jgi:hypothetical protein
MDGDNAGATEVFMSKHHDEPTLQVELPQHRQVWIGVVFIVIFPLIAITRRILAMARSISQHPQDTNGVLAVITNSGSTNVPGSTITINKDGSGTLTFLKGAGEERFRRYVNKTFPLGTFDSSQLEKILSQIKDVETIPKHDCFRSISFGSITTVTYQGKTSGDISCLSDEDAKIFQDLKNLVQRINTQV